jgi:hypothetical protein
MRADATTRLREFSGIANVYLGWGIKIIPTRPGSRRYRPRSLKMIEKLKTASLIAGAALLVVACGEKKAEEAPAAEAPAAEEAAPAADAMAPAADAMAPAADAAAPAADAMAPAADAAAAPAPAPAQ